MIHTLLLIMTISASGNWLNIVEAVAIAIATLALMFGAVSFWINAIRSLFNEAVKANDAGTGLLALLSTYFSILILAPGTGAAIFFRGMYFFSQRLGWG